MPNILDYLTWRGDVPFSVSPPNEVDNYIHCKIGTLDFTGIVPENELYVPLPQAVEAYFAAGGAEKLLGKAGMLYAPQGAGKPTRVQGCFVSDDEVQRIVEFVRGRHSADYNEDVIEQMNTAADEDGGASSDAPSAGEPVDEMLAKAIELAVDAGQVSISMLQRRLRVGYARAGRLVDEMTQRGITAEAEGPTKPRTVLISREEWRRMQENQE